MNVLVEYLSEYFLFLLFLGFSGYALWSMFSKSGRGRMLGGEIIDSAADEIVQKEGALTSTIRAHVIQTTSNTKHVGLEISENAKLGASFRPMKLSKKEAETLVKMINEVLSKT